MGGGGGGRGRGGCERRIEVFVKIQKKMGVGWGVRVDVNEELKFWGKFKKKNEKMGGGGGGSVLGGQGGCERGIEVFVKIQKKKLGGGRGGRGRVGAGGVSVDVNEEFKFM